jgi:hypothetical protein
MVKKKVKPDFKPPVPFVTEKGKDTVSGNVDDVTVIPDPYMDYVVTFICLVTFIYVLCLLMLRYCCLNEMLFLFIFIVLTIY